MLELKTKQEILKLLSTESDSEHCESSLESNYSYQNILNEEKIEKRLTEHPIIHKITVDCAAVVKQETRHELDIAGTEVESADNVDQTAYELKVEKPELEINLE